jgi:hypothetical protein
MKKILWLLVVVVALSAFVLACVSKPEPGPLPEPTPKPVTPKPTPPPPPPPQIIEHKTSDFGGAVPNWVTKSILELEKDERFADYYVFIVDQPGGKDLIGLQTWAKEFSAQDTIAGMIYTRVKSKFVGALAGDTNMVETYMEQVVKNVSEAEYSGLRVDDEFWIKKRYFDQSGNIEKEEYRYLFLMTVPKKSINDAIQRAMEGTPPETKEEKAAVDRVKESWGDGL